MVKTAFCLAVAAVATFASAQTDAEERIRMGMEQLRGQGKLFFLLEGDQRLGGVTKLIKTAVYWQEDAFEGRRRARFALETYEDNVLVHRAMSDGETAWNYDLVAKRYQAANYGGFGTARAADYEKSLIGLAQKYSRTYEAYAVRLLREIVADDQALYRSWLPGSTLYELPQVPVTEDPVLPKEYYYSSSPTTALFMLSGAPRRMVVYQLEDRSTPNYWLDSITFSEREWVKDRERLTHWTMQVYVGYSFDEGHFVPYNHDQIRTWKPVVGTMPFKG